MENATKALLIAAAVLIAIVLIALGVRLLGSANDTSDQAGNVSDAIGTSTNSAVGDVTNALTNLPGTKTGTGN